MVNTINSINEVLDFWYAEDNTKKWFSSTPEFDMEIKNRFESLWQLVANGSVNQKSSEKPNQRLLKEWTKSAEGCLALCIVLDQFPLNMFRGEKKSFETEKQSIEVAKAAISKGFDDELEVQRVAFLYMPLMHSEELQDQDLSVACFLKSGLESNLRFAQHHRDIIEEFGRFPHRNAVLARASTIEEVAYLNSKRAFTA